MVTHPHRRLAGIVVLCATAAMAACTDDDTTGPDTTPPAPTTTVATRVDDGELRLGILRPPAETPVRDSITEATQEAVDRVNDAGGVLGERVELVEADEGQNAAATAASIEALLDEDVDAIIGPMASPTALATLDEIVSAGVLSCSPTASALALDEFPDDGLFFRTIPSDSLQAVALAEVAEQTGAPDAAVVYVDDAYGRPFAEATAAALGASDVEVVASLPFNPRDEDLADVAREVLDADPQVIVALAAAGDGPRMLAALDEVGATGVTAVVVNDAMRTPGTPQQIQDLSPTFREKVVGVAPQAEVNDVEDPLDPPGPFGANAIDCVNLIALAASQADSDSPTAIAGQMAAVSSGGSACRTYAQCIDALEGGRLIDYNGPSGVTELRAVRGDPSRARFDRFGFDDDGLDVLETTLVVSL